MQYKIIEKKRVTSWKAQEKEINELCEKECWHIIAVTETEIILGRNSNQNPNMPED